jgi:hypothetical protein
MNREGVPACASIARHQKLLSSLGMHRIGFIKQSFPVFLLPLTVAILGLATAHAERGPKVGGELTCSGPVTNKDTGESLYERYGKQVSLGDFQDRNYNSFIEVELFASTEANLEVKLEDNDFVKNVAAVEVSSGATAWSVSGVKIGMSLEAVAAINGGPFKLKMTDHDSEGTGIFSGGRLEKLDGGCRLDVLFTGSYDPKILPLIAGKEISSDNPDLVKEHPHVTQLSLSWPRR